MKKFSFNLQKLLDIREIEENRIKNELAELISLQNIERTRKTEYIRTMNERRSLLSSKMKTGKLPYEEIYLFERFYDSAGKAINSFDRKIESMEPAITEIRDRLIEASRKRKVVEKLKEKKQQEYFYELNRETIKENDDMNQKLFFNNSDEQYDSPDIRKD